MRSTGVAPRILEILVTEAECQSLGHDLVVQRLAEALSPMILRANTDLGADGRDFLAGFKDPRLAR